MEDLSKIILTMENAWFLRENPCFRAGMTAKEYEEEEARMKQYGIEHGDLQGYVPLWEQENRNII